MQIRLGRRSTDLVVEVSEHFPIAPLTDAERAEIAMLDRDAGVVQRESLAAVISDFVWVPRHDDESIRFAVLPTSGEFDAFITRVRAARDDRKEIKS